MTLVRRVAIGISMFVVSNASPGSKEWAEGLAREVDFIEDDWSALAWAIGSVRVLFGYRLAPIRSMMELTAAAEKFAESKRHDVNDVWFAKNTLWIQALFLVLDSRYLHAAPGRYRVGNGMAVLGLLVLAIHGFLRSRKKLEVPDRDDLFGIIGFYRAQLKRLWDLSSLDFWIYFVAPLSIIIGWLLAENGVFEILLCFVWMGCAGLFLQMRRNLRRRLEQIEALLGERQ